MMFIDPPLLYVLVTLVIALIVFAIVLLVKLKMEIAEKLLWGILIVLIPVIGSASFILNYYLKVKKHS
jgi:hypothetical protein